MSDLIYSFSCQIAAGTAKATPATFALTLPALDVDWLEWDAPAGFNGVVGFYFASHGQAVIPFTSGSPNWIVANDRNVHWDLSNQFDTGDWQLIAYNLGAYPHTLQVRFGLTPSNTQSSNITAIIPAATINA